MGFTDARRKAIDSLRSGLFRCEDDQVADGRNLLGALVVTPEEVVELLQCCRGGQHQCAPHHWDRDTLVHVFKPIKDEEQWYIKVYFLTDEAGTETVFMSVHKSIHGRR